MNLDLILVLFQIVVLFFSFSVHECAHGYAAYRRGDATAYMLGRVTLNPLVHIDLWGSILMPAISFLFGGTLIGWGKPVPITLRNFKKIKRDDMLSTAAGLFSHLALALVALALLIVLKHTPGVGIGAVLSAVQMVNKVPVDMTALPRLFPIALLLYYCVVINILLFVFNLIPVPPLDGSRFIRYVLSYNLEKYYDQIGMLGSFILFFVASRIIFPIFLPPLIIGFNTMLLSF